MDTGITECQECDTQGSWIPATHFWPIPPKPVPIYEDEQAHQLDQANLSGSESVPTGFSQGPQAKTRFACFNSNCADINRCVNNWEATSAEEMVSDINNMKACTEFSMDPMDRWKNVPFADLLALANAASVECSSRAQGDNGPPINPFISTLSSQIDSDSRLLHENGHLLSNLCTNSNYDRDKPKYELPIPHQHSYDLNFSLGTRPNAVSHKTISEFAPVTPDKVQSQRSNQVSELQNSCTDDRTNQGRGAQNNTGERVDSNSFQYNKDLLQTLTDASIEAASTQFKENYNPGKGDSHVIDLNKTPQRKPRRKKHRPKVAKGGKSSTPKPVGSTENPTGKRKYTRRKGMNKDSTISPPQAAGESIDQKTLEPTKESCRKTLNFDIEGQPREEKSKYKSASNLVSESETKDFYEGGNKSKSTIQLREEIEVTILKPVSPKPAGSTENPKGKRKYVRKKGLNKHRSCQEEAAGDYVDPKAVESAMESCRKTLNYDIGQHRDENSTCKSAYSKENPTGKRKYVRKKELNIDKTSSLIEVAVEYDDMRTVGPTKKSCRRALNFNIEGQHRDEDSTCKSSCNLDSESRPRDFYGRAIQSKSTVQLSEGIELTLENTQAGIAYDLTCSVNQMLKDYMPLPEGQEPGIPLPTKTNPQQQKQNAGFRKENDAEGKGQGTANIRKEQAKQIMMKIETQSSPIIPNESKCNAYTILIEQGQAEASSSNLVGVHYHTLQAYQIPWVPKIYKKKRTEKGQNSTTSSTSSSGTAAKDVTLETTCSLGDIKADSSASKINNLISAPQSNNSGIATRLKETGSGLQDKEKTFEGILALSPTERLTKKRSRGLTRVRDLASLTTIAECTMQLTYPGSQGPDCYKQQVGSSQRPQKCVAALVAETCKTFAQKKRTKKRNFLLNSASSTTNKSQKQQKFNLYSHQQFSANSLGTLPELRSTQVFSIDAVSEQFKHLDINRENSHFELQEQNALVPYCMINQEQNALVPYCMRNQEQNALVLYSRDGTVVPFQGSFDFVKKRHPRPKVELDGETNRVWKLLMENINSDGIDGTDEENTKWWEEERRVFHGRVDSFIARMHLVQGDRRFSQWKGSVVDSVVGVFLTQNVSDHLSSSAYMSLAAQFPLKSKNQKPCYGEGISPVTDGPVPYILDPEDTVEWTERTSHQPACDQSSMTLHDTEHNEEKEVVSSNESLGSSTVVSSIDESKCKKLNSYVSDSEAHYDTTVNRSTTESTETETMCFTGGRIVTNDVLSSQNSMDSSIAQKAERFKSSSDSNSEAGDLTNGSKFNGFNDCSFVELLQMARSNKLHQVYNHGNGDMSSGQNSKDEHQQFPTMEYENQSQKVEDAGDPGDPREFLEESDIPSSSFIPPLTRDSEVAIECYEMFREETGSSGIFMNNDKNSVTEQSSVIPEFASQTTDATKLNVCSQEAPRSSTEIKQASNSKEQDSNRTAQHQREIYGDSRLVGTLAQVKKNKIKHPNLLNFPGETLHAIGSSIAFDNQENNQQKTSVSDLNKHDCSFSKELNEFNDATSQPKGRRFGKDKKNDSDWDSLRRQVEANGRNTERPENTKDSLDWEAVRCADVHKIANTIKERGMNNMLAERIKDFLNRLVREHGSIDLEWLRDVPPDKAKEYLLSIRGLGLKSVECVRLLTLHHLAFPVDTNVGRIAVRLGWVPLQPLPESLQLHLLELYPVLESIQKYLWPRLCKLDQRTLYELHYQMITFGKVFCTKSKPNCNACPMRGECRHFASAFASSRLALPGPEERSIVSAKETRTSEENPAIIFNQLPLPLPHATDQPERNQQSEEKSVVNNCEPIIEEPATPEPECTKISEIDIEDTFCEDPDEIPTIKLNMEDFTLTLQNYIQDNMELQEGDMSKALVALTAEVASIPTPKLKNVSRLRTEHQVYELPDSHPLLEGLEKREPDDPGRYLLAIWAPGETANSIQPPERRCSSQEHDKLCAENTCFSCNSVRESQCHIVRGTLLIPCRTAMRGSFPLNGTYFQVNEVFADHDSSLNPINVPREWLWNLQRRTVYFGTSIPTIFKGLTTEGIQHCFWRGYVCVRGFDQKTRAPRPLMARLHFPASKLSKTHGKTGAGDT